MNAASPSGALRLSAGEALRYESDGFLVRQGVFTERELAAMRLAAERAADAAWRMSRTGKTYTLDGNRFVDAAHVTIQFEHADGSETVRVVEPVVELDPDLDALVDDARICEPMRDLVGSEEIALWTDKLNLKRPWEGSGFGWHQDSPYWIHDCAHVDRLPNVMVTLDDAGEDNGCFRVVRGSHKRGCLPGRADGSQLGGFFTDPDCFDAADGVPMAVPAGSLVFFSPHSVHGSLPNRSSRPRRAIVLTYQPAGYPMLKSGVVRNVSSGAHD